MSRAGAGRGEHSHDQKEGNGVNVRLDSRFRLPTAIVAAGVFLLSGLGASGVAAAASAKLTAAVASDSTGAPTAGTAWIRVLHGSPDAPAVDVYVDGTKAITVLAFGTITDYTPVPAGNHAIKVCATGSTTVCPIDLSSLALADGKKYTIAATGELATITPQVIEDAPPAPGQKAEVRVVHLSADTPAVDVLTADKSTKLVPDLTYPKASGYLALDPGTYSLIVCAAPADSVCPLGPLSLQVAAGQAYSVFAIGSLQATLAAADPAATAAPAATLPPTSTDAGNSGTSATPLAAVLLVLVFALGAGASLGLARRSANR